MVMIMNYFVVMVGFDGKTENVMKRKGQALISCNYPVISFVHF